MNEQLIVGSSGNRMTPAPTSSHLARLWQGLLTNAKITNNQFDRFMNHWLDNPANQVGRSMKSRSTERGNLTKELFAMEMTWKVFHKAVRFLAPKSARFTIELVDKNGRIITSSIEVPISYGMGGEDDIYVDQDAIELSPCEDVRAEVDKFRVQPRLAPMRTNATEVPHHRRNRG